MTDTPESDHLLPPGSTPLERALSGSDVRLLAAPHWLIRAAWDVETCPVHLLPYLAVAWSVDEWDTAWSEAQKRQAVRESIWIHQHKGTIGALKRAVGLLGMGASVKRWFDLTPRGDPYTFRLYVRREHVTEWTGEQARRLYRVAMRAKALRSYLDRIVVQDAPMPAPVAVGLALRTQVVVRIVVAPESSIRPPLARVYVGCAPVTERRLRVVPRTV